MTQVTRRELMPGVWLRAIHTDKFKSSYLGLTMLTPLERETAAANALIPAVLRRGHCRPSGPGGPLRRPGRAVWRGHRAGCPQEGRDPVRGLCGQLPGRRLRPGGGTHPGAAAALLGELLSPEPRRGFLPDYVRQEQNNLIDRIRAQVNDKRRYASARLCQLMCREEAFGVDKLGDEAHAAAITPEGLWARYQQLLRTAEIEVYYCGSAQPERGAQALTAALSGLPGGGAPGRPSARFASTPDRSPSWWRSAWT